MAAVTFVVIGIAALLVLVVCLMVKATIRAWQAGEPLLSVIVGVAALLLAAYPFAVWWGVA